MPNESNLKDQSTKHKSFDSMSLENQDDLPSSELGTKEYWDSAYEIEIKNFQDHGDVGEVWFGEDSACRIARWLTSTEFVSNTDPVIDLGCGNGMLLIELAEEGFTNLTGVDYSEQAIELAKRIAKERGLGNIKFMTCDIVSAELELGEHSVVLDKGTYDAISLNPVNASVQRIAYKNNLKKILKRDGVFIIASCNWTEEELKKYFESDFSVIAVIPAPKFQFGGKVGSSVTTIVFKKNQKLSDL